jgi:hypothetical protein
MRPGEPGRLRLEELNKKVETEVKRAASQAVTLTSPTARKAKKDKSKTFDLS